MATQLRNIGVLLGIFLCIGGCQDEGAPEMLTAAPELSLAKSEQGAESSGGGENWVFRFEQLVGNEVTGVNGNIRGQNALGAPWKVESGEARLSKRGELRVKVEGLVLIRNGLNPITSFKAILSCQTNGAANTLATVNISTALVPAGPEGDFEIREQLTGIPSPCYAPIVLITNANGSWGAVSGF